METFFDCNTKAIHLLQHQRLDEAIGCLRTALKALVDTPEEEQASFDMLSNPIEFGFHPMPEVHQLGERMKAVSPHNTFSIFDRAVSPQAGCPVVLCLTFNLGFAYHCKAAATGRTQFLEKALRVYEACFVNIRRISTPRNETALQVLALAVVHNIRHIHSHCFNTSKVRECSDCITSMLCSSPRQEQEPAAMIDQSSEDVDFFRTDCVLSRGSNKMLRTAPAA